MNDVELDAQLGRLFEAEKISLDPQGAAAADLFDEMVGVPETMWLVDAPAEALGDAVPESEDAIVELNLPRWSPVRFAVAAAIAVVALLGAGFWLSREEPDSPVISDDTVDEDGRDADADGDTDLDQNGAVELIEGREEPLVILLSGDASFDDVDGCVQDTAGLTNTGSGSNGWGVVAFANGVGPTDFAPSWTIINDVVSLRECSASGYSLIPSNLVFDTGRPVDVVAGGTTRQDGGPEAAVSVIGVMSHEVVDVQLLEVGPADQIFRQLDGVFRIDALHEGDDPDFTVQAELMDGTVEVVEPAELVPPCEETACLADELVAFSEAASAGDAVEQAEALADGVLTRDEYELADQRFQDCLTDNVGESVPPLVVRSEESAGVEALDCWNEEIVFVEFGRVAQNGVLEPSSSGEQVEEAQGGTTTGDAEPLDESADLEEFAPVDAMEPSGPNELIEAARNLFADGLDRNELEAGWDGYPYGVDERQDRIDTFLTDFAWMSGEVEIEVNLFEQFEGSGFFVPVVTAWPVADPSPAAAFVLGGTPDDLDIWRIPELDNSQIPWLGASDDGIERIISVEAVGVEGGVSAFMGGVQLEVETDLEEFVTFISLPSDAAPNTVITVVSATPELPGAGVLVTE